MTSPQINKRCTFWTNYHCHSNYCDGKGAIEDYVKEAIRLKMPIIGFSSHAPLPFDTSWTMKNERLEGYKTEIEELKKKYMQDIEILLSLEVDYIPNVSGPKYFRNSAFNYLIGSLHYADQYLEGDYWTLDGSLDEFVKGVKELFEGDIELAIKRYFELNRLMMQQDAPDILGHFDKVKMHNYFRSLFSEKEKWYDEEIAHTLECAAEHDVIIEVNTKSLEKYNMLFPGLEHFEKLVSFGNKVTINSDAHHPSTLTQGFEFVARKLKKAGLKTLTVWKNGGWIQMEYSEKGIVF